MMDSTLAQLLNHIVELEVENMQLKQALGQAQSEVANGQTSSHEGAASGNANSEV